MGIYKPKKIGDKWYAVREVKVPLTQRWKTIIFKDHNGHILEMTSEEFASEWCDSRNKIMNLL